MKEKAIEIKDLKVNYGNHTAIEDINFEMMAGTMNAVVGPNGSGKTTLLKSLLGLVKPMEGEILVYGKSIDQVPPHWIGYVPQLKTLDRNFPARAIELVVSGIKRTWTGKISNDHAEEARATLALVGASDLADRNLSTLSGGELQKVYLARSLVKEPKVLLLDEPASGIDMVCEANINSLIDKLNRESRITVIMVTHNWATAQHHAEYVLFLNKIQVAFGRTEEMFTEEKLSRTFRHIGDRHDLKGEIG